MTRDKRRRSPRLCKSGVIQGRNYKLQYAERLMSALPGKQGKARAITTAYLAGDVME